MKEKLKRSRFSMQLPASSEDGTPPSEFRVFTAGLNQSEQGPCVFDEIAAASVMDQYATHGKATLLDFNHGTEMPYPTPEQAITAGEFVPELRSGELWATQVKWTDRAIEYLKAKEYRYFSPCFEMEWESRRVMRLISIALTNRPALDNIAPLVAASANHRTETDTMDELQKAKARIEELEKENATLRGAESNVVALSAAIGVGKADALGAVQRLVKFSQTVQNLAGVDTDAKALGTIEAWKAKAATADEMVARDATRTKEALTVRLNAVLDQAVKALKLPPALREFELKAALGQGGGEPSEAGIEFLTAKFAATTPAVNGSATQTGTPGTHVPTASETKMDRVMGINTAKFAEWQTKQQQG